MPPLIRIKLVLNYKLEIFGIYDSGSNVSLINARLLKLKDERIKDSENTNLKTINGVRKINGMVTLKVKIFNIEKTINVFVIDKENFDYDFLIGLDCITKFGLAQNEKLKITQKVPETEEDNEEENKIKISKEIKIDSKNEQKSPNCSDSIIKRDNKFGEKYLINFNEHVEENILTYR